MQLGQKLIAQGHSIWSISCSYHGYTLQNKMYDSPNQKAPGDKGITCKEAVDKFVIKGEKVFNADFLPWPNNKACAV